MRPNSRSEQWIFFQIRLFQPFTNQIRNYGYICFLVNFKNSLYLPAALSGYLILLV